MAARVVIALAAAVAFGQTPRSDSQPWVRVGVDSSTAAPVSQGGDATAAENAANSTPTAKQKTDEKRGQLVAAPVPISSPFLGSGLGVITAYVVRLNPADEVSPPSMFAAGGMYTNNGTWAAVGATKLYFSRDRYRATVAAGRGDFHYDLYGVGQNAGADGRYIPIKQGGSVLFFQGMRRLPKNFFLGPRYQIRSLTLKRESGGTVVPPEIRAPEIGIRQQTAALGFAVQNDSRNSQFYPTSGGRINFSADFFRESVGSNRNYERYQFEFHRNPSLSPRQVLAYRFYACAVGGRVPIYDLCLYGLDSDIRGYSTGRYRDRRMFAAQTEYRLELPKRFGVVAFAGVGGVAPTVGSFRGDALLPAGGAGLRYNLDKKNHINFRFDYAVGRDRGAYYVGVAEAF
jgi:outer membrane protein assembly factor BamA